MIAATLVSGIGCNSSVPADSNTTDLPDAMTTKPTFTVHDVFYIAPPVDAVIATGVVDVGTFRIGDTVLIADRISSEIGKIESILQGELQEANSGDNVGLHLIGVDRQQVQPGHQIVIAN